VALIGPTLIEKVPRDHQQSDSAFRRRRMVVALALVVGAALLGISLSVRPGDAAFYPLTLGVAAVWAAGAAFSGPVHLGYLPVRGSLRRPVLTPILLGLFAAGMFLLGALVVREIPPLRDLVNHVLAHARRGQLGLILLVTLVNGVAEELFFRGAVFAAIGRRHPVLISTGIYAVVTVATGNPVLVFAALVMGLLFATQRRATGGVLAPMITHLTWSTIMVLALPPLLAR
jgi:membrane protease YdiL (CAAX protease family)